jgi:hypothetical protein
MSGARRPPSIFDSPVDDVTSFLADDDFNALPIDERIKFISDTAKRFQSMSQTDSAVAAAFFAGLSGPASEQMVNNARVLGKDILMQGAAGYQNLKDDKSRAAFIEQWLVKWVRFGRDMTGRQGTVSDQELLDGLSNQAKRDVERQGEVDEFLAQQMMDFWERDVMNIASPREQGEIFLFLPAVRDHLLRRGQ